MTKNTRRTFLRIFGVTGLAATGMVEGQESHGEPPKKEFRGVSKTGDVDEALRNAISAARRSVRHPDAMVQWTIKQMSGKNGGIAGFNEITIVIEAELS